VIPPLHEFHARSALSSESSRSGISFSLLNPKVPHTRVSMPPPDAEDPTTQMERSELVRGYEFLQEAICHWTRKSSEAIEIESSQDCRFNAVSSSLMRWTSSYIDNPLLRCAPRR